MPFGDLGMKKHHLVINSNHPLAAKVLSQDTEAQKSTIQYCLDLAMLEKNLLNGAALERFINKAKELL
jgi:molecular chaperone HtpG